ncbi:MmgE/PrpD family protein [Brucellaceae bacterium D45D]
MNISDRVIEEFQMSKTTIEAIAGWLVHYQPTQRAITLAQHAIADTLACIAAGRNDEIVSLVAKAYVSERLDSGNALLVVGGRAQATLAALINATAAHAIDYDDNFKPGMSHASAVIVPALLAAAGGKNITGRRFIEAYLVALQAQAFVGSAMAPSHYSAGWHGTSTVGCIGTAAGVAYLLGTGHDGIARAMSLGASFASGTKGQFGSAVKPVHAGIAARNAVDAALMASAGVSGRIDILERSQGFLDMFGGKTPQGYDVDVITNTETHVIETIGVMPKIYACCGSTHPVLDMILDLQMEEALESDDIAHINCKVRIANYKNLPFIHPLNEKEARFSMHYCVARALRAGAVGVGDFTPAAVEHFGDDTLIEVLDMHHYTPDEEAQNSELPHIIEIQLRNGNILRRERALPKGSRIQPLTDEDRANKFADCCGAIAGHEEIFSNLNNLWQSDNLTDLYRILIG